MITPDEIVTKANRLYPKMIQAWLKGDEIFPHVLRSSKALSKDVANNIAAVRELRSGSKSALGCGYTVEWTERRLKDFGRNEVPDRILFETREDLLRLIGKFDEFATLQSAVTTIRNQMPQLEDWLRSRTKLLISVADVVDDLIHVTQWFQQHPRPGCFTREIPVDVDTKFVEEHQRVLQEWFDVDGVLPADAIRSHEKQFFRRYGLRDKEPFVLIRFLDAAIQQRLGFPCDELRLPLTTLKTLPISDCRVFVLENETNVRTFPRTANGIVLFGSGNAAVSLSDLTWLNNNQVTYWGDLDVDGLEILSRFRRLVPNVRSQMMDLKTLQQHESLTGSGNGRQPPTPALLTNAERDAFHICASENIRLEQERIPQAAVLAAVDNK